MRWLIVVVLGFLIYADAATESFITKDEYAKMLYYNPRGISCAKCHGDLGEGKIISTFIEKSKPRVLQTGPIYHLDFKAFKRGVGSSKSIMPKYYLTDNEIAALYYYLQSANRKKARE